MIVEDLLIGAEYAVDMFYNHIGEPIILNIYHHPIPCNNNYLNVLYYTNKDLFDKFYTKLIMIFEELNRSLSICNFPIHAEFINQNDELIPVEMNPLRFGGYGLADLTYHAYQFNPFQAFVDDYKPKWSEIFKTRTDNYGWILGYNGTDIDVKKYEPNVAMYKKYLGDTLNYIEMDYTKNPVFSIAYIRRKSIEPLLDIINIDFNEFFIKK